MRIFLIIVLALIAGVLLGTWSTIDEFRTDAGDGFELQALNPWHEVKVPSNVSMFYDPHTEAPAEKATKPVVTSLKPAPKDGPQPKARVDADSKSFGTVEEGDEGTLTYLIYNDGKAPLQLEKGRSSCKCTVSNITKKSVPPGESSEIVVDWRTSVATPKFNKRFSIKTNDRQRPTLQFAVTGQVLPVVSFEPRSLSAFTVVVGETTELKARLLYYRDVPLEIRNWRLNNREIAEFFDVTFEPLTPEEIAMHVAKNPKKAGAKSGYLVRIKVKPGIPVGDNSQELTVRTNAERRTSPKINMFVRVHEAVSVFGTKVRSGWNWTNQSLALSHRPESPHYAERLVLQAMGKDRADIEFKVKEVVPAKLKVELGERQEQHRGDALWTDLHVSLPDEVDAEAVFAALPEKRGKVVIETTHPKYPELSFGVSYVPQEQEEKGEPKEKGEPTASPPGPLPKKSTAEADVKGPDSDKNEASDNDEAEPAATQPD